MICPFDPRPAQLSSTALLLTHGCWFRPLRLRVSCLVMTPDKGMPRILLKQAKQASPWMMLCGLSVVFNTLG